MRAPYNKEAMEAITAEMAEEELPWVETLDIVAGEALNCTDVHDDLARELAFYEQALASVKDGRERLKAMNTPWKRPEDFFCEMIKSDAHMARVKDKLLFEQKKMEAFEQRKAKQTQRKFAKAAKQSSEKEKLDYKKDNLERVEKWRDANKERRKRGLEDDDGLDEMLGDGGSGSGGPNKKRKNLDKKYGFGGLKNKKATRNDNKKSLNDMREFNPKGGKQTSKRGGGGGGGGGKGGGKGGGGGGGKRPGKAARAGARASNRQG